MRKITRVKALQDDSRGHAWPRAALTATIVAIFLIAPPIVSPASSTDRGFRITADPAAEEVIFDDRLSRCSLRQFPDAPARAVRQADGEIILFATFETNWFLKGPDWNTLEPVCGTSGRGAENSDPDTIDDKYWIEALHTLDGKSFIALGSHEYLGIRHPGRCTHKGTPASPFPCWYASITQYFSAAGATHFAKAGGNYVVARPQVTFDPTQARRVGFFTTSNIVTDGRYRYAFIYTEGADGQPKGNCLFRSALTHEPSKWLAWGGTDFDVDLSQPPGNAKPGTHCRPIEGLPREVRGLVKHRGTNTWIAINLGRDRAGTGVFYSRSTDLFRWSAQEKIIALPIARTEPDCPSVYRYPSVVDHGAPEPSFETIGNTAYLYSVKIILDKCKLLGRQIVRIPLQVEQQ